MLLEYLSLMSNQFTTDQAHHNLQDIDWFIHAHTPWMHQLTLTTMPHVAEQELPTLPLKVPQLSNQHFPAVGTSVVPQAVISHRSLRSQCEHLVSVCICFTTILLKSINSIVSLELFNQPLPKRQHWHVLESWLNLNQIVLKQSPLHHPHARDEAGAKACSQVQPQAGKQKQHTLIVYEIVCMIAQVHKRNLWSKLVNELVWMHNVSQVHKMNQLSVHEGQTDQHQSCQAH